MSFSSRLFSFPFPFPAPSPSLYPSPSILSPLSWALGCLGTSPSPGGRGLMPIQLDQVSISPLEGSARNRSSCSALDINLCFFPLKLHSFTRSLLISCDLLCLLSTLLGNMTSWRAFLFGTFITKCVLVILLSPNVSWILMMYQVHTSHFARCPYRFSFLCSTIYITWLAR